MYAEKTDDKEGKEGRGTRDHADFNIDDLIIVEGICGIDSDADQRKARDFAIADRLFADRVARSSSSEREKETSAVFKKP